MHRAATYVEDLDLWIAVRTGEGAVVSVGFLEDPPTGADGDHPLLSRLRDHVRGRPETFEDVPVDLSGLPAFSRRVLEALREVPPGETTTYGELAERIASPGAARAVGGAVASNPAAVVVPCHRVVRADGSLGGYSGGRGPETKRRLLRAEGAL